MKRLAFGVLLAAAAIGAPPGNQSSVYACDRSAKERHVEATGEDVSAVTVVDVVVAGDHAGRHHFEVVRDGGTTCGGTWTCGHETTHTARALRKTAHVAVTLGRALATAFGAVVGSLVDAANAATASIG